MSGLRAAANHLFHLVGILFPQIMKVSPIGYLLFTKSSEVPRFSCVRVCVCVFWCMCMCVCFGVCVCACAYACAHVLFVCVFDPVVPARVLYRKRVQEK